MLTWTAIFLVIFVLTAFNLKGNKNIKKFTCIQIIFPFIIILFSVTAKEEMFVTQKKKKTDFTIQTYFFT